MSESRRTILAVDHDRWAVECYRANHGADELVLGEVEPGLIRSVDLVLAGPPCQPYSTAGSQAGADDERDGVPAFCSCVEAWRPRVFVVEQVAAFATQAKFAETCAAMLARLEDAGYRVQWRVLDAYQFGVPQFRNRAWFIGSRVDLGLPVFRWPVRTHFEPAGLMQTGKRWVTTGEALGLVLGPGGRIEGAIGWSGQRVLDGDRPAYTITGDGNNPEFICIDTKQKRTARGLDKPAPTVGADSRHHYRWTDEMRVKHPPAQPAQPAQPAPTVMAKWAKGGAEGLLDCGGELVRRLTTDECARLQSVPDGWVWPEKMPKGAKYRVVGNGWACGMAARIGEAVRAMDPAIETVADLFCGGGLGAAGFGGRHWRRSDSGDGAA